MNMQQLMQQAQRMQKQMEEKTTERFGSDGKPKNNKSNTKKPRMAGWVIIILILLILSSGIVICHENEYKLVRRFGRVERTISASGLYFKIPIIESVDTVPRELLIYDLPASDVIIIFAVFFTTPTTTDKEA